MLVFKNYVFLIMQYLVEHDLGVAYGNDYDLIHYVCMGKLWESLPGAAGNVVHFGVLRQWRRNGTYCRPRVGRDSSTFTLLPPPPPNM